MIQGIKLKHGATFVLCDGVTIRVNADGTCELSPVLFQTLERELRTEPPSTWTYITESELSPDTRRQIARIIAEVRETLGE